MPNIHYICIQNGARFPEQFISEWRRIYTDDDVADVTNRQVDTVYVQVIRVEHDGDISDAQNKSAIVRKACRNNSVLQAVFIREITLVPNQCVIQLPLHVLCMLPRGVFGPANRRRRVS
jgi:hypothetical protein